MAENGTAQYYKNKFRTWEERYYDIYVLFIELGFQLVRMVEGGVTYILPHKFINANYGEATRELIAEGESLQQLTHFGDNQVFEDASTYTCLLFLSAKPQKEFKFNNVSSLLQWKNNPNVFHNQSNKTITEKEWVLLEGEESSLFEKLIKCEQSLEDVTERIFKRIEDKCR